MEKYVLRPCTEHAGGGEYPLQDGFGWTNGVTRKLMQEDPITGQPLSCGALPERCRPRRRRRRGGVFPHGCHGSIVIVQLLGYDERRFRFQRSPSMENQSAQPRARRKHRSLAEELVAELSQQIRDGVIKRGDKLPTESAIMQAQVSAAPWCARRSRGCRPRGWWKRGTASAPSSGHPSTTGLRIDPATIGTLRDLLAILELRISTEVESAGLAAQHRSPEQLAAMRAFLDQLNQSAAHSSDAVASDFQFHLQIAEATGNRYFTDIMSHGHHPDPAQPGQLGAPGP